MASIVQKPNGTYLIRIFCGTDENGKVISRARQFTPSRPDLPYPKLNREIEEFTKQFEKEAKEKLIERHIDRTTFRDFIPEYLNVKRPALSPSTIAFYEKVINGHLLPMFGNLKMSEIRTHHIQQYITYLASEMPRGDGEEGHIAASTVKRYTTVLRSILTLAYKLEYIDEDIALSRRIEFPKEDIAEIEVYTLDEVGQILSAVKTEPLKIRLLVELALFTGCRRGEIVGLKWEDVDFTKRKISIKRSIYKPKGEKAREKDTKTKHSVRTIGIPECLCQTLRDYYVWQSRHISFMGDAWQNNGYIFTEADGHVMNPQTPTRQFDHFLSRHGIRHLKLHGLRHTSATLLLSQGCDIKTVSARLGHSDIDTTNIYLHMLEEVDRDAADTFDKMFGKVAQ